MEKMEVFKKFKFLKGKLQIRKYQISKNVK